MFTVTKIYRDLPAAHRQPNHDGHCRLIHGHNWGFDITFLADKLDPCGFVVDVGRLQWLKKILVENFDHTLLLNEDDPFKMSIEGALGTADEVTEGFAKIVYVPNCGMEGLAKWVFEWVEESLEGCKRDGRNLRCLKVVCWEDSKNSAMYCQ